MITKRTVKIPPRKDLAFRTIQDMRSFARAHTPGALKVLVEIYEDHTNKAAARVSAAREILDRGWGRPQQQVVIEQPDERHVIDLVADAEFTVSKVMDLPLVTENVDGKDS